jgi:hypothetical protein
MDSPSDPCMKNFPHAFRVRGGVIGGDLVVTVDHGTVNGYEPLVKGQRISGLDTGGKMSTSGPPVISGPAEYDAYGRVYVCLRVKIDPESGKMKTPPSEEDLTVVVSKNLRLGGMENAGLATPVYWNHPIAVFSDTRAFGQIAYFNYLHFTGRMGASQSSLGGSEGGLWYHYFCVA